MKKCLHNLLLLSVFLGCSLLGACGKTGPLYLPTPDSKTDSPATAAQDN